MIMSLPDLSPNLEETDFAKNFPMDFSISTPELDLAPSFPVDVEEEVDAAVLKDGKEKKIVDENVYEDKETNSTSSKSKREGDDSENIPILNPFIPHPFLLF